MLCLFRTTDAQSCYNRISKFIFYIENVQSLLGSVILIQTHTQSDIRYLVHSIITMAYMLIMTISPCWKSETFTWRGHINLLEGFHLKLFAFYGFVLLMY